MNYFSMSEYDEIEQFDLSEYGFLPSKCVDKLPICLECLKDVVDMIRNNGYIDGHEDKYALLLKDFRNTINYIDDHNNIDEEDIFGLKPDEIKFVYSITSMIVNIYVWCEGVENTTYIIPRIIGVPWYASASYLYIAPSLTHASVDLYNWSLIDDKKDFSLDNLKSNYLMTRSSDEEWFYLIMVAIEGVSGEAIKTMYNLIVSKDEIDRIKTITSFSKINKALEESIDIISRMRERCNPKYFFNTLRIFLSGSNNEKYFPDGFKINNFKHERISYTGGSAAQSSLIQLYDIFFDIHHDEKHASFLDSMREYMPMRHRNLLIKCESYEPFCDRVLKSGDKIIIKEFNNMIKMLHKFRNIHFHIAHQYITAFIMPGTKIPESKKLSDIEDEYDSDEENDDEKHESVHGVKGTGGTDYQVMLNSLISDTADKYIENNNFTHSVNNDDNSFECIIILTTLVLIPLISWWWIWLNQ
jgi:hypothetical protein